MPNLAHRAAARAELEGRRKDRMRRNVVVCHEGIRQGFDRKDDFSLRHVAFLGRQRLQELLHADELAAEAHLVGVFRDARALVLSHGHADLLDQEAGVLADAVGGQVDREQLAGLEDRARREQRGARSKPPVDEGIGELRELLERARRRLLLGGDAGLLDRGLDRSPSPPSSAAKKAMEEGSISFAMTGIRP